MASKDTPAGGLGRDFGYLFPFFEKIAAAARAMPEGAARARVERLVAEERGRWEEIRALLGGQAGTGAVGAELRSEPAAPPARAPIGGSARPASTRSPPVRTESPRPGKASIPPAPSRSAPTRSTSGRSLTVGSLRPTR